MTLQGLKDVIRYGLAALMVVACILNLWLALYVIGLIVVSEIVHWVVHGDRGVHGDGSNRGPTAKRLRHKGQETHMDRATLDHADVHQKGPPDASNDPLDSMDR